jgi:hypothetical protein
MLAGGIGSTTFEIWTTGLSMKFGPWALPPAKIDQTFFAPVAGERWSMVFGAVWRRSRHLGLSRELHACFFGWRCLLRGMSFACLTFFPESLAVRFFFCQGCTSCSEAPGSRLPALFEVASQSEVHLIPRCSPEIFPETRSEKKANPKSGASCLLSGVYLPQ